MPGEQGKAPSWLEKEDGVTTHGRRFQIGELCGCVPVQINTKEELLRVRVQLTDEEAVCPFSEVFTETSTGVLPLDGALLLRNRNDLVSLDRLFVAEVTALTPLTVSRRRRVEALWKVLEEVAGTDSWQCAQILRQTTKEYRVSIEGNVLLVVDKAPFKQYLLEQGIAATSLPRHVAQEGDQLLAKVVSADAEKRTASLDIVAPLRRLDADGAVNELLDLYGIPQKGSQNTQTSPPPVNMAEQLWLGLSESSIPKGVKVMVVDDRAEFAGFVVRELTDMGCAAQYCAPSAMKTQIQRECPTHLLIDADCETLTFLDLLGQILDVSEATLVVIVMSALSRNDALTSNQTITLGEALSTAPQPLYFWPKLMGGHDIAFSHLASLIAEGGRSEFASRGDAVVDGGPLTVRTHDSNVLASEEAVVITTLADLQKETRADCACLCRFDTSRWYVNVESPSTIVVDRADEQAAQSYLPFSPIRDIAYQQRPYLVKNQIMARPGKFWNLLRLFNPRSIEDPVDPPPYDVVVGRKLVSAAATRHSLFLFWKMLQPDDLDNIKVEIERVVPTLDLAILRGFYQRQTTWRQPFYFDGLARTGRWHDAKRSLYSIESILSDARHACGNTDGTVGESIGVSDQIEKAEHACDDLIKNVDVRLKSYIKQDRPENYNLITVLKESRAVAQSVAAALSGAEHIAPKIGPLEPDGMEEGNIQLRGFQRDLRRVIENVLVNAVEHGLLLFRQQMRIRVLVSTDVRAQGSISIWIVDNGPGIRGIDLPYVFDPLYSTKPDGYGMGLAITREVCERRGIKIRLAGTAYLGGCCFQITVPRHMTQAKEDFSNA